MRLSRLFAATVLVVVPIGIATTVHAGAGDTEVRRIRSHFDSVLTELSGRDVGGLTTDQRARRSALTETLRAYRDRGVFPHNYDFPGRAVPYFVDRKTGTLCAVANLLASTGRRDIVDRVARADNNVSVAELAGDTGFTTWLDANGMTLAEAARVQVPYARPVSAAEEARMAAFVLGAPTLLVGAVTTGIWNSIGNSDGHRRVVSWTGVVSGFGVLSAGALLMTSDLSSQARGIGATSAAIGALSMAVSMRAIHRHGEIVSAEREAAEQRSVAQAMITPMVTAGGGRGVGLGAGLAVSVRF